MPKLDYDSAYSFYKSYIFRTDLFLLLESRGLNTKGSVPSVIWELFGSILTGQSGKLGHGSDLVGYEVKSAIHGNASFEYQYHLNTGLQKLQEDKTVDHIFCNYSADYKNVDVYLVKGSLLAHKFDAWIPEYEQNYCDRLSSLRRQRFRKGISRSVVIKLGSLVMKIEDCDLKYTNLEI
jgi:hypothetical protein